MFSFLVQVFSFIENSFFFSAGFFFSKEKKCGGRSLKFSGRCQEQTLVESGTVDPGARVRFSPVTLMIAGASK